MFFERNGDDNPRTDVRAAPAFSAAPELYADVEVLRCHGLCVMSMLTACQQRSRVSCADGARSGYEYCLQDFDIRPSTEKPLAGMFFVLSSLVFRGRDVQARAWRYVQILRENAQRPRGQLVRCKNPEPWQYHAPLRGGASRSSLKFCSKPGDGFRP